MRIVVSVVWLVLAVAFFNLGRELYARAQEPIPVFETDQPRFEFSSEGFHLEFDVTGTPLEQPFEELRSDVEEYLSDLEESLRDTQTRAALGCFGASGASVLSLLLLWWSPRRRSGGATG